MQRIFKMLTASEELLGHKIIGFFFERYAKLAEGMRPECQLWLQNAAQKFGFVVEVHELPTPSGFQVSTKITGINLSASGIGGSKSEAKRVSCVNWWLNMFSQYDMYARYASKLVFLPASMETILFAKKQVLGLQDADSSDSDEDEQEEIRNYPVPQDHHFGYHLWALSHVFKVTGPHNEEAETLSKTELHGNGYAAALQALWNKMMHSAHGNEQLISAMRNVNICDDSVVDAAFGGDDAIFKLKADQYSPFATYYAIQMIRPAWAADADFVNVVNLATGALLVDQDIAAFNQYVDVLWNDVVDAFAAIQAARRNREMHSYNGNPTNKQVKAKAVEQMLHKARSKPKKSKPSGVKMTTKTMIPMVKNLAAKISREEVALVKNVQTKAAKAAQLEVRGKVSKETEKVILCLTAPTAMAPVRYADAYATEPTAMAAPFFKNDLGMRTDSNQYTSDPFDGNFTFAAVFRDPVRHAIQWYPNQAGLGIQYNIWINSNGTAVNPAVFSVNYSVTASPQLVNMLFATYETSQPGPAIHGPMLGMGVGAGATSGALLMSAGSTINQTVYSSTGTNAYQVTPIMWSNNTWVELNPTPVFLASAGSWSWQANVTGYYRFSIKSAVTSTNATFTLNVSYFYWKTLVGAFGQKMLNGFETKYSTVDQIRINACSLMYSNTSAEINKSGSVVGYQSSGEDNWIDLATKTWAQNNNISGLKQMSANNGMYAFLKPTNDLDFEFFEGGSISPDNVTPLTFTFNLDKKKSFIFLKLNLDQANGRSGYFTWSSAVEFKTEDMWWVKTPPGLSAEVFTQAIEHIRNVNQFHENPFHMSDLYAAAKKVAGAIVKYGPKAMTIASMFL